MELNDCIGIGDCTSLGCPNGDIGQFDSSLLGLFNGNNAMLVFLDLEDLLISCGCTIETEEGLHVTVGVTVMSDLKGSILQYFLRRSK